MTGRVITIGEMGVTYEPDKGTPRRYAEKWAYKGQLVRHTVGEGGVC